MTFKRIVTADCSRGGVPAEILREISVLKLLSKSPNIVHLLKIDRNEENSSIVLEFDCGGEEVDTLQNLLARRERIPMSVEVI